MNFIFPNLKLYMKSEKLILLLALCLGMNLNSHAQPFPPQPRAIPPPVGAPVPIDSEIWMLLVSGVLLGVFFILKKLKSST